MFKSSKILLSLNMKKVLLFVLLLPFCFSETIAQKLTEKESRDDYFKKYEVELNSETINNLSFPFTFTSIVLIIDINDDFNNSFLVAGLDTFYISENTDINKHQYSGKAKISKLIIFEEAVSNISLLPDFNSEKIEIHLLNAGIPEKPTKKKFVNADSFDCSKPETIDQSIWRAGLPNPKQKAVYTKPEHIIIHHSAGSNSNTNHLNTIRNIYLYHTQSKGWNDIGYNYVIARDGTIYDGRDNQGIYEEDFILGAHFCGKNSNTMGVSILGTYTNEAPTKESIFSLKKIISWKLLKDSLNPLDSFLHPKYGSNGYMLAVISGHRNGCATECPGEILYLLIPDLRNEISWIIKNCKLSDISTKQKENDVLIFPQPAKNFIYISSLLNNNITKLNLYNIQGQFLLSREFPDTENNIKLDVSEFNQGLYFIELFTNKEVIRKKILIK